MSTEAETLKEGCFRFNSNTPCKEECSPKRVLHNSPALEGGHHRLHSPDSLEVIFDSPSTKTQPADVAVRLAAATERLAQIKNNRGVWGQTQYMGKKKTHRLLLGLLHGRRRAATSHYRTNGPAYASSAHHRSVRKRWILTKA